MEHLPRWIFINDFKGIIRHPKEIAFISKIEQDISRKKFSDIERYGAGTVEMFKL
jgi:hypothetical protein